MFWGGIHFSWKIGKYEVTGNELLCNAGKKLNGIFTALDYNFDFIFGMVASA
jgi:hypothetical protein